MNELRDIILSDAIKSCIDLNEKIIIFKRIIYVLSATSVTLAIILISVLLNG